MPGDWQVWVGGVGAAASIGGLIFSLKAWLKAGQAAAAAAEAREAVRRDNAGEDLDSLSQMAKELLAHAQGDEFQAALVRSRDLLTGLHRARQRWAGYLEPQSAQRVGAAAKKIEKVCAALSAQGAGLPPEARTKVVEFCQDVLKTLSQESGRMARQAETGEG